MSHPSPSTDAASASKINKLTQEDVTRLLNPEEAMSARLDVTSKLAEHYELEQHMSSEELLIAEQIFRLLVRDTELAIRKKLAIQLKASNQIPRDIALTMANDVAEVALPVLQHSSVLTDTDLSDIIAATSDMHRHVAIASRSEVSEALVDALLEHSDRVEVANRLASNQGAVLNEGAVQTMMTRHSNMPEVMDVLANRPNLPPTIKEKVISYVSEQIKSQLSEQYASAKDIVQQEATQSRLQATLDLINEDLSEQEMRKLVQQLVTFERLTADLLMAAVVRGYIHFYIVAMAEMAGIPMQNAVKLMRDQSGLGFRGLYNKCKLPPEYFSVFRDITPHAVKLKEDVSSAENKGFAKMLVRRVVEYLKSVEKPYDHVATAVEDALR